MALTNATLASACAASDSVLVLSASTGVSAGYKIEVDGEVFQVTSNYTTAGNGVNVPVLRGQNGTYAFAHPSGAKVRIGPASDADWGGTAPQTITQYPNVRARVVASYTASGAITLPTPGADLLVYLNGTSVCAMTIAAPQTALDGSALYIASNGAAAHTLTFASGLSGAGSSYDVLTVNATAPVVLGPFFAVNGFWQLAATVPISGTVTNITAALA